LFKIIGDLTSLATSSNVGFGTVTNGTSYLNKYKKKGLVYITTTGKILPYKDGHPKQRKV
jgi:hypothetical protein